MGDDVLLKSVSCTWLDYFAVDKKFESVNGNYWINRIYKNYKLIFEQKEKSDVDKTISDLRKEIFDLIKIK